MADKGLRISWAMLAVKPSQSGQFQLLRTLLDTTQVFEKYEDFACAAARLFEAGVQFATAST